METITNHKLTITQHDYDTLMQYLKTSVPELKYDRQLTNKLKEEVKEPRIVNKNEFPRDMVRLNSKVTLRNTIARQNYEYTLVLPENPETNNDILSVLAPLGGALLGASKGDTITMPSPRGKRIYTIVEVVNPID